MSPKSPNGSIQPTSRASSNEDSLLLGTPYLANREQNFRQRRIDITYMYHMLVHGVRSYSSLAGYQALNCLLIMPLLAHRTLIARKLKGLDEIIPYTAVHWEMLEKGSHLTIISLQLSDAAHSFNRLALCQTR
jgi:glutathionyl-hydroquinone reductase